MSYQGYFYEKLVEACNSPGIFYNFYPSQGKVMENKLSSLHITFINSYMIVREVFIPFIVSKCELYHLS